MPAAATLLGDASSSRDCEKTPSCAWLQKPMVDFDEFDQPSLACLQVQRWKIVPPQELQFYRQRWAGRQELLAP